MQRYQVSENAVQLCEMINLPVETIARNAGLPLELVRSRKGVNAREYYALFAAAKSASDLPDFSLTVGRSYSGIPHNSETAAFVLSPDVATGLERLALFKPLICPVRATVRNQKDGLRFILFSADPTQLIPQDFQALHPIFILSLIRATTGADIIPLEVGFDGPELEDPQIEAFFGVRPRRMPHVTLLLSQEDAERPLLSANPERWGWLEPGMRARIKEMEQTQSVTDRVAHMLIELLPAGLSGIETVSDRLHLSKRSLQRALQAEGSSYQDILSRTRRDLAFGYLKMPTLTIDEIAYLLAYQEPNSFYRAFQSWTGQTPLAYREA